MQSAADIKKYLDLEDAMARLRGNKKMFLRLLSLFTQNEKFDELEQAVAAGDITKCAEAAHAIKGMTGSLSMPALFEESMTLMNAYREGRQDDDALARYRDAYEKTRAIVADIMAAGDF